MDIGPILSTLRRHRMAASLIVVEIALTCAVLCNAVFLISQRVDRMHTDSGVAEAELIALHVGKIGQVTNGDALTEQDLAALRSTDGVQAASIAGQLPYGPSMWLTSMNLAPAQERPTVNVALYEVGDDWLRTTGVRLVQGRDFLPEEYQLKSVVDKDPAWPVASTLLTRRTAERLFPNGQALGQTVYVKTHAPLRVVGIVDVLAGPRPADEIDRFTAIVPSRPTYWNATYLVRAAPGQRDAVLQRLQSKLEAVDPHRLIEAPRALDERRAEYYAQDRAMAGLLVAVCAALLTVTAFGIVGLASFWVQQRTRMIGTRRALGATRRDILRYFQTENFLLASIGIALGMVGAYGLNHLVMSYYELPRLPWTYLPIGAMTLWLLGQLAVLGPALRAAALSPMQVLRGQ